MEEIPNNHLRCKKKPVNNGINYQAQLVGDGLLHIFEFDLELYISGFHTSQVQDFSHSKMVLGIAPSGWRSFEMFWILSPIHQMARYLLEFPTHLKNPKKNVFIFCNSPGAKRNSHKKKVESSSSRIFKSRNIKISGVFGHPGIFARPCLHPVRHARYPTTWRLLKLQDHGNKCLKQKASQLFQVEVAIHVCCNLNSFHWNWFWIQVHPFVLLLFHLAQFRVPWTKRNWLPMMFSGWLEGGRTILEPQDQSNNQGPKWFMAQFRSVWWRV